MSRSLLPLTCSYIFDTWSATWKHSLLSWQTNIWPCKEIWQYKLRESMAGSSLFRTDKDRNIETVCYNSRVQSCVRSQIFQNTKNCCLIRFSVTDWTVSCSSRKYACSSYADNKKMFLREGLLPAPRFLTKKCFCERGCCQSLYFWAYPQFEQVNLFCASYFHLCVIFVCQGKYGYLFFFICSDAYKQPAFNSCTSYEWNQSTSLLTTEFLTDSTRDSPASLV